MLNAYFQTRPEQSTNGGIKRVLEAQFKYLPTLGVNIVDNPDKADVTVGHVAEKPLVEGKPLVLHNHGMMWRDYDFPSWAEKVNHEIVDAMRVAYTITSPSQWVTRAINRGVYFPVQTVYHGVDTDEWQPGDNQGYILWNKARADAVSNPQDLETIARILQEREFASTIPVDSSNVKHIGITDAKQMNKWVSDAGLYLCTARETFGIGTLEALACGVPVVGWDYGGQSEIIIAGETGYLAPYGDYSALADCIVRAYSERERLSRNARQDAIERWGWADKIQQYASIYERAVAWYTAPRPKVTVVVPAHNLGRYLPYTLKSIQDQTIEDFECIIIDDCSTDNTSQIARAVVEADIRFRYHKTTKNLKLSGVRNLGAKMALGKYICYVDADDVLTTNSLELQSKALDQDRSIHIAYGALDLLTEDGKHTRRNRFPSEFNWYAQMAHLNQVPTGAMMRREVIEHSGGWRDRQWRAEDAEFWSRVTSFGYVAKKVTDQTTLMYRVRSDSKGSQEFREYADHDGNWLANIGWRSANSASEGMAFMNSYGNTVPQPSLVPFGAQGETDKRFWDVYHRQEPQVLILVDGTDQLEDTLDSIVGQYNDKWEVYVFTTQNEHLSPVDGFPFALYVNDRDYLGDSSYITVKSGEMYRSDWLGIPEINNTLLPKDKIPLQYTGTKLGRMSFRVNGRLYSGQKANIEWVHPDDVERLLNTGSWLRIVPNSIPEPQLADIRK